MSPILKEIKDAFDKYLKYRSEDDICQTSPFILREWIYCYLFPEILLVWDETVNSKFNIYYERFAYPCWTCSEEQVLRIMAEHGLL